MMDLTEAAGEQRLRPVGLVEKVEGFQKGLGVGPGGVGEGPDDPGVAALLLGVSECVPHPPARLPVAPPEG